MVVVLVVSACAAVGGGGGGGNLIMWLSVAVAELRDQATGRCWRFRWRVGGIGGGCKSGGGRD